MPRGVCLVKHQLLESSLIKEISSLFRKERKIRKNKKKEKKLIKVALRPRGLCWLTSHLNSLLIKGLSPLFREKKNKRKIA